MITTKQADCLGRKLLCRVASLSAYETAILEQLDILLIDLDPRLNEFLRLSSIIFSKLENL